MRLIVSGSRNTGHREAVQQVKAGYASYLKLFPAATTLLQGGARGIDAAAKAFFSNLGIPVENYPADWNSLGNAAGPRRNRQMAEKGEVLLSVWDGESRGTKSMITEARKKQLPVVVTRPDATGAIWLTYGISPARIAEYHGWVPGTILDRQGDLFKIAAIDGEDVLGYRSNSAEVKFGTSLTWLPVDWGCTDVTKWVGEG
jgi:hypothetical protein